MSAQIRLITIADFTEETFNLPSSLNDERFNTSIDNAQNINLKPLIGEKMFSDFLLNVSDPKYIALLNGDTYADSDGDMIIFPGLRFALVNWTMSHYYPFAQQTVTSHSVVRKLDPRSEPIEGKEISRAVSSFLATGAAYWNDAKKYITTKKTDFPLYCFHASDKRTGPLIINSIGGND